MHKFNHKGTISQAAKHIISEPAEMAKFNDFKSAIFIPNLLMQVMQGYHDITNTIQHIH